MGRIRFLAFYLLAGISATALQTTVTLWMGTAEDAAIPNVGASGAVSGVLGAYLVLLPGASVLTLVFFFLPLPWSVSLFSAACAAAAAAVLDRAARESGASGFASAGAAWLLAFGPSFWAEANIQRVYALNALFLALAFPYVRGRRALQAAALAGLITLGLLPVAPAGVPIVTASLACLLGLRR